MNTSLPCATTGAGASAGPAATRTASRAIEHARSVMTLLLLASAGTATAVTRSEEHTSELQSHSDLVCRLLLEKKKKKKNHRTTPRKATHNVMNSRNSRANLSPSCMNQSTHAFPPTTIR